MNEAPEPRTRREPMVNLPGTVSAMILVLLAIHTAREFIIDPETDLRLLIDLAVIPARWLVAWNPERLTEVVQGFVAAGASEEAMERLAFARYALGDGAAMPWTALTYALLHGSWGHVILNCVWLAAFGAPVALRLGPARLLLLFAASTVAGALAHFLVYPTALTPMIGASGGISGMMGAASRFAFSAQPWDDLIPVHHRPLQGIGGVLRNRRAALFLGVWLVINMLFGIAAGPLGITASAVAWEAHIGGLVAGFLLIGLLDPRARRRDRS